MVGELHPKRGLGYAWLALFLLSGAVAEAQDGSPGDEEETTAPKAPPDPTAEGAATDAGPPEAAQPLPATLLVAVNVDGAQVAIGETVVGETPLAAVPLPPGSHTVRVAAEGFEPVEKTVTLATGEEARLDVRLAPKAGALAGVDEGEPDHGRKEPFHKRWYFWAGVGGAALITGVALIALAASSGGGTPPPDGFPVPPIRP